MMWKLFLPWSSRSSDWLTWYHPDIPERTTLASISAERAMRRITSCWTGHEKHGIHRRGVHQWHDRNIYIHQQEARTWARNCLSVKEKEKRRRSWSSLSWRSITWVSLKYMESSTTRFRRSSVRSVHYIGRITLSSKSCQQYFGAILNVKYVIDPLNYVTTFSLLDIGVFYRRFG